MIEPVGPDLRAGPLDASATSPAGWLVGAAFQRAATCFLVADWWIATALHAVDDAEEAADRVVVFNFLQGGDPSTRDAYALAPENGYIPLDGADVALVRLRERPGAVPPGRSWGRVALASARTPALGEPVCTVCHWLREGSHVKSFSRGTVRGVDDLSIVYDAAANKGASGAPVFSDDGAWLGIHLGEREGHSRAGQASVIVTALSAMPLALDLRHALEESP
ncbi:MAG TPA: serine protease [Usitatibacter sp.]|nr:serine protease [Usitatibacter sp.]